MENTQQSMEKSNKTRSVKGIKIRTLNYTMISVSVALYILLIAVTYHAAQKYENMISATNLYIGFQDDAALVEKGSDYLTEQVRLYTMTFDLAHVENYFTEANVTRRRDVALEHLQEFHMDDEAYTLLHAALDFSNKLMEDEIYAMKLTAASQGHDMSAFPEVNDTALLPQDQALASQEMIDLAREMVFGSGYQEQKGSIQENISLFLDSIYKDVHQAQVSSTAGLKSAMRRQQILISVLFVETLLTFILILVLIVKPLRVYVNSIKEEKLLDIVGAYEFKYLALTYNDIYEVNAATETMLRNQVERDPLTGIANRGAFDRYRQLLKAKQDAMALLIIDVDKFKLVNDGYGHETGDKILKKVANLLVYNFRDSDIPARIGGDEFAVIVMDIAQPAKSAIPGKIDSINQTLLHPNDGLPAVSLSVGCAFSENGFHDELYRQADAALYQVKENGRCGCRIYEEPAARE